MLSSALDQLSVTFCSAGIGHSVGHSECKFQTEGGVATNYCWCQKTRVIALSCGIKVSAVHCLVLSQYTRMTDQETDRITTANTALA